MSLSEFNDDNRQPELPLGNKLNKHPVIRRLFRFLTWWLVFTGIYASSSVCPFCGKVGCPVGGVGAGLVGGFFALVIEKGKAFLNYLTRMFSLLRAKLPSKPKA